MQAHERDPTGLPTWMNKQNQSVRWMMWTWAWSWLESHVSTRLSCSGFTSNEIVLRDLW